MTDRERVVTRLKKLIKATHNENRDFVYVTVGTARVIVRLLEEQEGSGFDDLQTGDPDGLPADRHGA
jgi:hypothetical protein